MKIGEKIKRVRLHRHMKQRELGELVGFTDGAANRIARYESGFRVPKEDMVKKIADALHVKECALLEPDTGNLGGIMETLFWLDEDMPDVLRFSLSSPIDKNQIAANAATAPVIQTNAKTSPFGAQPAMLWSENDLLNYLFKSFAAMQDALSVVSSVLPIFVCRTSIAFLIAGGYGIPIKLVFSTMESSSFRQKLMQTASRM